MERTSTPRRALLTLLVMVAGLLGIAAPASAQPASCSVVPADGGITVSWDALPDVETYVYRLEVAGENNRYNRVNGTSTTISLAEGVTGAVFVSGIRANGSYTSSANCGSASPNEGTGGGGEATCSITDSEGGIRVEWSAIDNATEYVYKLVVDGQARYRRVDGTQAFIPLGEGKVGSVKVSAVFANGSYSPSVDCGSGQALDGTGPVDPTCTLDGVDGGLKATWSAVNGAVTYVYRLKVDGKPNRYNRVRATTTVIPVPNGTTGSVAVSGVLSDGRYTRAVDCGTATAGGDNPTPVCTLTPQPGGVLITSNPQAQQATMLFLRITEEATIDGDRYSFPTRNTYPAGEHFYKAPPGTTVRVTNNNSCTPDAVVVPSGTSLSRPASCSSEGTTNENEIKLSWPAVDGAASYEVRWLSTSNQQPPLGVIETTTNTEWTTTLRSIRGETPGRFHTVLAVDVDGNYSPLTSCGFAQSNPGNEIPVGECRVTPVPGGVTIEWNPSLDRDSYTLTVTETDTRANFSDFRFASSTDTELFYAAPAEATVKVAQISADRCDTSAQVPAASIAAPTNCSSQAAGFQETQIDWEPVANAESYEVRTRITRTPSQKRTEYAAPPAVFVPSLPGSEVAVIAVSADGIFSAVSSCGVSVVGSGNPSFPAGPNTCTVVQTPDKQLITNWGEVDFGQLAANETAFYQLTFSISNGGAIFSEIVEAPATNFNTPPRSVIPVETPWNLFSGDTVTMKVRPVIRDVNNATNNRDGQVTDCPTTVMDGDETQSDIAVGATCSLAGKTVSWTTNPGLVDQFIAIQGFRTPKLMLATSQATTPGTYEILTTASAAADTYVTMFGLTPDGQITTSVDCGSFSINDN